MANTKVYQSGCEGFPPVTAYMMFGHRAKFIQRRQEDFSASLRRCRSGVPSATQKRDETATPCGWEPSHLPHVGGNHPFCWTAANTRPSSSVIMSQCFVSYSQQAKEIASLAMHEPPWDEGEAWTPASMEPEALLIFTRMMRSLPRTLLSRAHERPMQQDEHSFLISCLFAVEVWRGAGKPRASHKLGNCSTTELHPKPLRNSVLIYGFMFFSSTVMLPNHSCIWGQCTSLPSLAHAGACAC